MKTKNLLLTMVAIVISISAMAQVPSYVPTNGLVGWWGFNGNANDESGNSNNGTVTGATLSTDRFGNTNTAYSFNGTSNYIDAPLTTPLNTNNISGLTLSGWCNLNSLSAITAILCVSDAASSLLYGMGYDGQTTQKFWGNNGVDGSAATMSINGLGNPVINTWYNVVITYDYSNNSSKLYINGSLQNQSSVVLNRPIITNVHIGAWVTFNGYWYANGKLDDLGIWNRALTANEITTVYQNCNLSFNAQPTNHTAIIGANAQFTATTNSSATYQWQSNPNNFGWINVPANSNYSGVTSNALTVNNVQLSNHLQPFRIIATSGTCKDTSNIAMINIADTCIVTVTDTLVINAVLTGINPPNNVNTIKVFPNPANDHITINYGNFTSMSGYTLKITNNLGQVVFTTLINQQTSYVALSTWTGNGLYFVSTIDGQGNTVDIKKIVIQ